MISQKFLALSLVLAPLLVAAEPTTVINQCSDSIDLYLSGQKNATVPSNGSLDLALPTGWSGYIYTDAYGGAADGTGSTRAGFYGPNYWYYLVTDPNHFNTAVTINPVNGTVFKGYCLTDTCVTSSCANAFTNPPTSFGPIQDEAPSPPLYECSDTNTLGYTVTFCPGGNTGPQPTPNSTTLRPHDSGIVCLAIQGIPENGTPVDVYECDGSPQQRWALSKGETKVQLDNTNFCLDAGSTPGNGVQMKLWQCYDNLPAQDWYFTDDNRIALTNQGLCLDMTNGNYSNGNIAQTWTCTDNDYNQEWVSQP